MFPEDVLDFSKRNSSLKGENAPDVDNGYDLYHKVEYPYFPLDLTTPGEELLKEAKNLDDQMIRPSYGISKDDARGVYDSNGWRVLFIHALGKHKFNRAQFYGHEGEDSAPYDWTEVASECPETVKFLKSLPYKKLYRAWFAVLDPAGYISPHVGRRLSEVPNHKITFSLNHPKGFEFLVQDFGQVPFKPNHGFLLKVDQFQHCVLNDSKESRYHLITMGEPDYDLLYSKIVKGD